MTTPRTDSPLISVLVPVYNCRDHLAEAIECIRTQTCEDWELIAVDDGSTDGSSEILQRIAAQDSRLRIIRQENGGVGAALNTALPLARGKYLARMDADDLTPANRFAEQVVFLDEHQDITVVGGWYRRFGAGESKIWELPTDPDRVKATIIFRNPLNHANVMMRAQDFRDHGWRYSTRRKFPEDYDLWVTISERHRLANMPKIYLDYRTWPGSVTQDPQLRWRDEIVEIQCRMLARMGVSPNDRQRDIHGLLSFDDIPTDAQFIADAHEWLLQIYRGNQKQPALDDLALARVLTGRYIALYRVARRSGFVVESLSDSPFLKYVEISLE